MRVADLIAAELTLEATAGRMYGAAVGIVTSTADPDSLARVKVRYPWLSDSAESPWARVVSPMAGAGRGMVARPEIDDEVLVLFEHGDMRFPYVIGGVWNAVDTPPERGADEDNDIRLIRSRSGHEITLDDTSGDEKIVLVHSSGEHRVELSSSGIVIESSAIKIGSGSSAEALVLGDAFMELFNSHTHPTGVGPSGPPVQPMTAGTHTSTSHATE